MENNFEQNSRSGFRAKRKKTNLVLNSLIIIVLLLIIFVAYHIFASGNDNTAAPKKDTAKTEQTQTAQKEKNTDAAGSNNDAQTSSAENNNNQSTDSSSTGQTNSSQADQTQAVVSNGGSSPNVVKTTINPAWRPLGTSQTGEHTAVYDSKSVDWQEMINAISYATGLDPSNMTVYWLGRDRTTANASVGTVYSKDKQQKYRVYIKWVDGQGWVPTKVEELSQLEK